MGNRLFSPSAARACGTAVTAPFFRPVRQAALVSMFGLASLLHSAWALPPLPPGWTTEARGIAQIYRASEDGAFIELRVFPPEPMSESLTDWFSRRNTGPMQGIASLRMEGSQLTPHDVITNEGRGMDTQGQLMHVARGACSLHNGQVVYGEIIASPRPSFLKVTYDTAAKLFGMSCLEARANAAANKTNNIPGTTAPQNPAPLPAPVAPDEPLVRSSPATAAPKAYAYTRPGQGLSASQIEGVLNSWQNKQSGMTMQVYYYNYLLLKDGSYRDGLPPVALDDLDAAAARAGEPTLWGRWRKSGGKYEINSPQRPTEFTEVFHQNMREPAGKDERLQGTWASNSAYSTMMSVARSSRSVRFERDGSFTRSFSSSVVGGAGSADAGNAVHGSVRQDDNGSSSSVGGANFAGGKVRNTPGSLPDRSGSYRLNGYTLELRYNNGVVERLPFCTSSSRDYIWFESWEMLREKDNAR